MCESHRLEGAPREHCRCSPSVSRTRPQPGRRRDASTPPVMASRRSRIGERVWLWEAAWQRADGTAKELVVIPSRQAVRLPDATSMDVGASLGIPALTAHRCLTASRSSARRNLAPGALSGQTVLVAGGAGAEGHAAIQLARWAGARVVSTVSSDDKARLALAAGAEQAVNYRAGQAADETGRSYRKA